MTLNDKVKSYYHNVRKCLVVACALTAFADGSLIAYGLAIGFIFWSVYWEVKADIGMQRL